MKKEKSKAWLEFREKAPDMAKTGAQRTAKWMRAQFGMEPGDVLRQCGDGLWLRNPAMVLILVFSAALPVGADLKNALSLGLAATAVLALSHLVTALLQRAIPQKLHAAVYLAVTAGLVWVMWRLVCDFLPNHTVTLGWALPILLVAALLMTRTADFPPLHTPGQAAMGGLTMGLGVTLILSVLGALRELLGNGSLWDAPVLGAEFQPILLLAAPGGGLILLGCLGAAARRLQRKNGAEGRLLDSLPILGNRHCAPVRGWLEGLGCPSCFRGVPIALVSAGLVAMVIFCAGVR